MIFIIIVIGISFYILLFWKWRKNTQNFYPKDRPLIFGHRGSPSQITENTISSFEKALEQGVDGLEFDVRLTRDKKVVIFHDKNLMRLCGINMKVKDLTYAELQTQMLKKEKNQTEEAKVPLLDDLAPLLDRAGVINIEIKSDSLFNGLGVIGPVLDFIEKHSLQERCIVSCFNPLVLWRLKLKSPRTSIGFLYSKKFIFHSLFNMEWMLHVRPDNLHIHHKLLDTWIVKWARYKGLRINSYTINKRDIYHKAKELKIDGVFTDNIEYLK